MANNGKKKTNDPQILVDKYDLTYKQALFCIHYVGNATEAGDKAGYKNPAQMGYKLVHKVLIQEVLKWLNTPVMTDSMLTREGIVASFMDIATNATSNTDKLRALENISKIHGIYAPDKKAILGHFSSESLDRYTDKELTDKISHSLLMLEDMGIDIPVLEKSEEG